MAQSHRNERDFVAIQVLVHLRTCTTPDNKLKRKASFITDLPPAKRFKDSVLTTNTKNIWSWLQEQNSTVQLDSLICKLSDGTHRLYDIINVMYACKLILRCDKYVTLDINGLNLWKDKNFATLWKYADCNTTENKKKRNKQSLYTTTLQIIKFCVESIQDIRIIVDVFCKRYNIRRRAVYDILGILIALGLAQKTDTCCYVIYNTNNIGD